MTADIDRLLRIKKDIKKVKKLTFRQASTKEPHEACFYKVILDDIFLYTKIGQSSFTTYFHGDFVDSEISEFTADFLKENQSELWEFIEKKYNEKLRRQADRLEKEIGERQSILKEIKED